MHVEAAMASAASTPACRAAALDAADVAHMRMAVLDVIADLWFGGVDAAC